VSRVGEGCAELLKLARVAKVEDLPYSESSPYRFSTLAGPTCQFAQESPSMDFALYECRTGHGYMDDFFMTTNSRDLTVLNIPGGKLALRVPLPHNFTPYPAVLANAAGRTWLLLLRDGVRLEVYRLP
jgi:hypothetical protein